MKLHKICLIALLTLVGSMKDVFSQPADSLINLRLQLNLYQFPENKFRYYSMDQADAWANNFYETGFLGVNTLSKMLFNPNKSKTRRLFHATSNYLLGFAFSKYGSGLPIPLGEWQHEEYHRTVLGTMDIVSKNGMWLFHRWDGTVYGVSDEALSSAKSTNLRNLLYAYVSGVQAENNSTQQNVMTDFYHRRKVYKNPLYLYNAWYVWNYFRFSTSAASDSVKVIAPRDENKNPHERDFAGADLSAWAYDMFKPGEPFDSREPFPNGEGVNRRIGFSDLPVEAQDYLKKQQNLSFLNFLNPAIFCINRISIGSAFSFTAFVQYAPTHFGNDISILAPFKLKNTNFLLGFHRYSNYQNTFPGVELGINEIKLNPTGSVNLTAGLHAWKQPGNQGFFDEHGTPGGMLKVKLETKLSRTFGFFIGGYYKTEGWVLGNPYLSSKAGFNTGLSIIY